MRYRTDGTTIIPRAEVEPILAEHGDRWDGDGDFEAWQIRSLADLLRKSSDPDYHDEAVKLDALVDQYEGKVAA